MITYRHIPLSWILRIEAKVIVTAAVLATGVFLVNEYTDITLGLPIGIVATIGTAVAILLGFKNASAYDRWWEGRKIFGGITNKSRFLGAQLLAFAGREADGAAPGTDAQVQDVVRRHLAWVNALRCQLREQAPDEALAAWLDDEERAGLADAQNPATQILTTQARTCTALRKAGAVEEFQSYQLLGTVDGLFDLQGQAERLATTPLLRHYSYFTTAFAWIFVGMLPFGFAEHLGWATIPVVVLISTVFMMADRAGSFTEDPFEDNINSVPLSSICNTIEIDMLQQMKMEPVPHKLLPTDGVLM